MDFNIIAVTACVSGVAHTYMAAERLEKVGHHEKWHLKVETQGALGVENRITAEDIARAEVVLLVTDIEIDNAQRFRGLRTIKTSIKSFLLQPQQIVEAVKSIMKKPVVYVELP
ncbi:TPA: PTS fructose-like transporter subunit IIB [Klebsiella quasipneumoniae subsp. quasipneumoniae]|uniref:PTS fructose-like transporter subunit IIB n=1 Tax=Klebsiella quasipneumoniae TaxID=1463165 RepID=UPI001F3F4878|nr:PTS fructose-like transporter subunit IIB [Klebsiella quasipneumoniae]HCI6471960.1 PTS fructose-like transporter subunit IIB [Klebsiella quasipneumoniae subsp. quasipneumoniae]HCI6480685.1 PTS fructose-like transporter subunit IIB [Klebsiella quasipneumoniae subsp. quasipneumoniae]HCI6799759.1 PTS fructose-like transporter subunit IIB [Klebsiella quasipneumoniae subsp. quasipneumoniae]